MNVLVLGSGGREHTFVSKIAQSPLVKDIFVAPGNAGTSSLATNVNISPNDFYKIGDFVIKNKVDMVIVGPEDPLVNGINDFFAQDNDLKDISVIGPKKQAAQLEGSKDFAKRFMQRHGIPTARYATFTKKTLTEGKQFLETLTPPFVLKADGLAAGKGVLILEDLSQAKKELENMILNSKFGKASTKVVIEEFLSGVELSCFVLTDGKSYKILPFAKDYKRIGKGDTGLNTGGMGAISPVPFVDSDFVDKVDRDIIKPTVKGLKKDGIDYRGFIFIGLINVKGEPFVIEYNVRMGDPETQVVFPKIDSDIVSLFKSVNDQNLEEQMIKIKDEVFSTVVITSGGYPQDYKKGKLITGLDTTTDSLIFHAGTAIKNDVLVSDGGRVLSVSSFGKDLKEALEKSYKTIKNIHFDGMYYRKDIGFDL